LAEAGLTVWTNDGIDYGSRWLKVIARVIDECAAFVRPHNNHARPEKR
jgi:hypothetical protein